MKNVEMTDETAELEFEPENVENGAVKKYVYTVESNANSAVTVYFNADGTANVMYADGSSDELVNVTPENVVNQFQADNFKEAQF